MFGDALRVKIDIGGDGSTPIEGASHHNDLSGISDHNDARAGICAKRAAHEESEEYE